MKKEITPRFPESLEKLRLAVRSFNNNTRLSRLTGISVQTIGKIADGTTRFPWAQTVEAVWQVLAKPNLTTLKTEPVREAMRCDAPISVAEARPRIPVRKKINAQIRERTKAERFVRASVRKAVGK